MKFTDASARSISQIQRDLEKEELLQGIMKKQGIGILAGSLGLSPEAMAEKLADLIFPGRSLDGYTILASFSVISGREMKSTARRADEDDSTRIRFEDHFPTAFQWIAENTNKVAILRCGDKLIYSVFGVPMNGQVPAHARVTHVVEMVEVIRP